MLLAWAAALLPAGGWGQAPAINGPAWERVAQTPPPDAPNPGPGRPVPNPSDNPTTPDDIRFRERLEKDALESICFHVDLRQNIDIPDLIPNGNGSVGVRRRLQRYSDRTIALVDRAKLNWGGGLGYSAPLGDGLDGAAGWVSFGAGFSGESMVVRPIGSAESCDALKKLIDVREFKTVIPVKASRIAAMAPGELWRLPLTFNIGVGGGLSAAPAGVPVTLTLLGSSRSGRVSATLFRIPEDLVRLRLRIESARVLSAGVAVGEYKVWELEKPDFQNVLAKAVGALVARKLSGFLVSRLELSGASSTGKQVMLEYTLDPREPEQMEALAGVLAGRLNLLDALKAMLRVVKEGTDEAEEGPERIARIRGKLDPVLGPTNGFAGSDDYARKSGRFHLRIPILFDVERGSSIEDSRMIVDGEEAGRIDSFRADKSHNSGMLRVPLFGTVSKQNEARSAQAFVYEGKSGAFGPMVVFTHQQGFLRADSGVASRMAQDTADVARYIGAAGAPPDGSLALPVRELLPPPPPPPPPGDREQEQILPTFRRGVASLSLILTQKAVEDIVAAPAQSVLAAFGNALPLSDRRDFAALASRAAFADDGTVEFSEEAIREATAREFTGPMQQDDMNVQWNRGLAHAAAYMVKTLAEARAAQDPSERARILRDLIAGRGSRGSASVYEDAMRVLVQLTGPSEVLGEFAVDVVKKVKGEKDVSERFRLNPGHRDSEAVTALGRARARFSEPSELTD